VNRIAVLAVAILVCAGAHAQTDKQVPISVPPKGLLTTPVDSATQTNTSRPPIGTAAAPPATASSAPAVVKAPEPASQTAPTQPTPEVLRALVENVRDTLPMPKPVKPPPSDITLKDGVTEIIPVSQGRMNRFITPFKDPVIKMTDRPDADISRADSILYVLINSSNAVSLFIMDRSDPMHAMSLTLVPTDIPPVQVTLHLAGWKPPATTEVAYAPPSATESDNPYVASVLQLMRELALHKVPQGYSLTVEPPSDIPAARCAIPGATVRQAQWLVGHAIGAIVARVTNQSLDGIDLRESDCAGDNVLAVAAWPHVHLEPGEQTELYVLVRRRAPADASEKRPSVIGQGR